MKIEKRNNKLVDYDYIAVDDEETDDLVESESMQSVGTEIALGYDYYDRRTGEKLKNPKKLKVQDILELKSSEKINNGKENKHLFKEGDLVIIKGVVYTVLVSHYIYEENANNFDIFYGIS